MLPALLRHSIPPGRLRIFLRLTDPDIDSFHNLSMRFGPDSVGISLGRILGIWVGLPHSGTSRHRSKCIQSFLPSPGPPVALRCKPIMGTCGGQSCNTTAPTSSACFALVRITKHVTILALLAFSTFPPQPFPQSLPGPPFHTFPSGSIIY